MQRDGSKDSSTDASQTNAVWSTLAVAAASFSREGGDESSNRQPIQTKLTVGAPDDPLEPQADHVADQVMRMADPIAVQREDLSPPTLQRMCSECEEELHRQEDEEEQPLQAKSTTGTAPSVSAKTAQQIDGLRGSGQPLSPSERAYFEPRFGNDLGQVRIHNDSRAAATAKDIQAKAYTTGHDVVFGAGQYAPNTSEGQRLMAHELTHVVQQQGRSTPNVYRDNDETTSATRPLIVDDSVVDPATGQMQKSGFLTELCTQVCSEVGEVLAPTNRTTDYLDRVFDYLGYRDAAYVDQTLRRFTPTDQELTSAEDYIPFIVDQARSSAQSWVETGSIGDLPEGIPGTMASALLGSDGSQTMPSTETVQRKSDASGAATTGRSPAAIRSQLGDGRPLDGSVRSRMESAFATDFSHVRSHTNTQAGNLASDLNARAFAVGEHVAFGAGQYKPGTLVGDALIAHELAHVTQQDQGASSVMSKTDGGDYEPLEEDADRSAVGAVARLWTGFKGGVADIAQNAMPQLKSGLQLQRCDSDEAGFEQMSEDRKKNDNGTTGEGPSPDVDKDGGVEDWDGEPDKYPPLTPAHKELIEAADMHSADNLKAFSPLDALAAQKENKFHEQYKEHLVSATRDAIKAAAQKYDIPPEMLGGIVFNEAGGDEPFKEFIYSARKYFIFDKPTNQTSMGVMGIQLRRAAETLGYDPNDLEEGHRLALLESLMTPEQAIFIAAKHLSDLRDDEFAGKSAAELMNDEFIIIASRYLWGPKSHVSLAKVKSNLSYGKWIHSLRERTSKLLEGPTLPKPSRPPGYVGKYGFLIAQ